jgi:hypothetical protein
MNDLLSQPSAAETLVSTKPIPRLRSVVMSIALHPLALLLITFCCTTLLWACTVEPGRAG